MFGGIDDIDPAPEHSHGGPAGAERSRVRGSVDPSGKTADNGRTRRTQRFSDHAGNAEAVRSCPARSNDRHGKPLNGPLSPDICDRWSIRETTPCFRVIVVEPRHHTRAYRVGHAQLAIDVCRAAVLQDRRGHPSSYSGHRGERRDGRLKRRAGGPKRLHQTRDTHGTERRRQTQRNQAPTLGRIVHGFYTPSSRIVK